jgi:hypothetical protein
MTPIIIGSLIDGSDGCDHKRHAKRQRAGARQIRRGTKTLRDSIKDFVLLRKKTPMKSRGAKTALNL